jgi:hypothetical protein
MVPAWSAIEQTLRVMLSPREDVELAVLFCSAARGSLSGSSDVDLGVLLAAIERSLGRTLDREADDRRSPPPFFAELRRPAAFASSLRTSRAMTASQRRPSSPSRVSIPIRSRSSNDQGPRAPGIGRPSSSRSAGSSGDAPSNTAAVG